MFSLLSFHRPDGNANTLHLLVALTAQAVEVLKEKGVQTSRIIFVCLIAAPEGIKRFTESFPDVCSLVSKTHCGEFTHVVC